MPTVGPPHAANYPRCLRGSREGRLGGVDGTNNRGGDIESSHEDAVRGVALGEDGQELAERVGFEPTSPVRDCRFSRPVHSTALPPLRRMPSGQRIARASYCKVRVWSSVPAKSSIARCPPRHHCNRPDALQQLPGRLSERSSLGLDASGMVVPVSSRSVRSDFLFVDFSKSRTLQIRKQSSSIVKPGSRCACNRATARLRRGAQ